MTNQIVMGVDVSKDWLDVDTAQGGTKRIQNSSRYFPKLLPFISKNNVTLVVLEATGGYERNFTAFLDKHGVAVSVVNPRQVRDFAKGMGLLAKTDALDAGILRSFGEIVSPRVRPKPSREMELINALAKERMHLVRLIGKEKQRLSQLHPEVRKLAKSYTNGLQTELARIEKHLEKAVNKEEGIKKHIKLLRHIKGIGELTAITLLAVLPELGTVNNKEIAALAGLAPYNRDSGKHQGIRCIWGGRERARRMLWMCAVSASTHNPEIRAFKERLREAGKPMKVALTACMRKLLVKCNAIMRDQEAKISPVWT